MLFSSVTGSDRLSFGPTSNRVQDRAIRTTLDLVIFVDVLFQQENMETLQVHLKHMPVS